MRYYQNDQIKEDETGGDNIKCTQSFGKKIWENIKMDLK